MNLLTKEKCALVENWNGLMQLLSANKYDSITYKVAKICLCNAFSFSMLFNMAMKNEISFSTEERKKKFGNGILLPKLFWPTVRKKYTSDREILLKFEAEGGEFAKFLRSLEQFKQWKVRTIFGNRMLF